MRVEIAGNVNRARNVTGVKPVVNPLMLLKNIGKTHDLGARDERQPALIEADPHRLGHAGLMEMSAPGVAAEEIKDAGLIGGEGDRHAEPGETSDNAGRHRIFDAVGLSHRHRLRRFNVVGKVVSASIHRIESDHKSRFL